VGATALDSCDEKENEKIQVLQDEMKSCEP
jgi:hypothetical protein